MTVELPHLHGFIARVKQFDFEGTVLALDPGETTGLTRITRYKDKCVLLDHVQIPGWPLEKFYQAVQEGRYFLGINFCVYEAYHIYAWRLDEHRFSEVPTIQIIGTIKTLCIQNGVRYGNQTAQVGKAFFTDDRLKQLELYWAGKPHARDSLRHAAQYLTFGIKEDKSKGSNNNAATTPDTPTAPSPPTSNTV